MTWLRTFWGGLLIAFFATGYAQVPETDLFSFKLTRSDTTWLIHSPRLLSSFNQGGYTNQPEFISDDLVYVSVRLKDDVQNDIYGLHLAEGALERITNTPESEYSPTLTPDQSGFSCIRQNDSDTVDQRIFRYPLDRTGNGKDLLPRVYDIGYHAWISGNELAIFQVTDPPTLAWVNPAEGKPKRVLSGIGRCLKSDGDGGLLYVHKYSNEVWYLKQIKPPSTRSEIIVESLKGSEDFAVTKEGVILSGSGSVLYSFHPGIDNNWKLVADLSLFGIEEITRLAINRSGDLIIVNNKS